MTSQTDKILGIIADHLVQEARHVIPTAHIFNDLGADQLDELEIIMALEEEFEIEMKDGDYELVSDFIAEVEAGTEQ